MKKNLLTVLLMVVIVSTVQAQTETVRRMGKIEIGPGGIGFNYEAKVGKSVTLDIGLGLSGHYHIEDKTLSYIIAHSDDNGTPSLYLSFNPRIYYNLKTRNAEGKNTENNSGNYFGAKIKLVTDFNEDNSAALFNIHWGLQRSLGKSRKWLFNTHAGIGYAFAEDYKPDFFYENRISTTNGMFYPSIEAKFAYILSKRNKN